MYIHTYIYGYKICIYIDIYFRLLRNMHSCTLYIKYNIIDIDIKCICIQLMSVCVVEDINEKGLFFDFT